MTDIRQAIIAIVAAILGSIATFAMPPLLSLLKGPSLEVSYNSSVFDTWSAINAEYIDDRYPKTLPDTFPLLKRKWADVRIDNINIRNLSTKRLENIEILLPLECNVIVTRSDLKLTVKKYFSCEEDKKIEIARLDPKESLSLLLAGPGSKPPIGNLGPAVQILMSGESVKFDFKQSRNGMNTDKIENYMIYIVIFLIIIIVGLALYHIEVKNELKLIIALNDVRINNLNNDLKNYSERS